MKKEFDSAQLRINKFQRFIAMMLSFLMVFSLCGTELFPITHALDDTQQETQTEIRDDTKARLMKQIRYEGWDPYSSDMTLEEFYALMELFDEGKLPIDPAPKLIHGASGMEKMSVKREANADLIPRTLFMFSGLPDDGSITYKEGDAPLPYDNDGSYGYADYQAGLDPYKLGYQVPPESWAGVSIESGKSQVIIAAEGQNDNNSSVAGNVVQPLFKSYTDYGYYVRRVTAENNEATVLGAIKLPGQDKYVYYYLTDEKQSTDVSTTMLADGKKFIIEYYSSEHLVDYEVHMDNIDSEDIKDTIMTVNVLGTDMTDTWENIIFGTNHPNKTDNSAYSFTAYAPYGYTVELYLQKTTAEEPGAGNSGESKWAEPIPLLSTEKDEDKQGTFKEVNGGWALGMEPDYFNGNQRDATILPDTSSAPPTLTMSGNIYNNDVHHDRKLIAVVHKKEDPTFLVAPLKHNTNNVSNRGTSAITKIEAKNKLTGATEDIPYDYEDVYLWAIDGGSKYDYTGSSFGGASKENLQAGNLATNDSWQWQGKGPYNSTVDMNKEDDGTYSYQWTWQTNNTNGGYTLDSLEINGVAVPMPFFPKLSKHEQYPPGTSSGSTAWFTETDIGNGIHIKVEFLMVFKGSVPQRVYRITATGARSNVTISAMNLIMGIGASEYVARDLTGVTDGDGNIYTVEYFIIESNDSNSQWRQAQQGSIHVSSKENGENVGINYNGDSKNYGANFRFKLADGYASPYYLWESTRSGVIEEQASAERDADGNVILSDLNPVIPLENVNGTIGSQNIYGPDSDGWYYIRVTTQGDYQVALLTIGAKQVRYVVRYMPGIIDDTNRIPTGMPAFDHTNEPNFDISSENADQYDTANGSYYDVTVDTIIRLPDAIPSDPSSGYKFRDWVLVNLNGEPVTDDKGNEFHYRVTHINLIDVVDYAVPNENLGGDSADVYVLRLMPCWDKVKYPLHYNIALNWVDAQGQLHEDYFDENWKEVLTDWSISENGNLTIQVIQNATPFMDWIAEHPTYIFWDEVNTNNALYRYYQDNADNQDDPDFEEKAHNAMSDEMEKAIKDYLPSLTAEGMQEQFNEVLDALCTRDISGTDENGNPVQNGVKNGKDDFWRLGSYAYQVFEDYATIVVWMREDKGGLLFHKEVKSESFLPDEEFYFTVTQDQMFNSTKKLSGTYKAYPEKVYDENGNERERLDRDAWLVTFQDGAITGIVKNDGSHTSTTFFTLKSGEGIGLYLPAGRYSVTETGSQSGLPYQTSVIFTATDGRVPTEDWVLPDDGRLIGSEKSVKQSSEISQVTATIDFEIGAQNVVQTLHFTNSTLSLRINCEVLAPSGSALWNHNFGYQVQFTLPAGEEPPKNEKGDHYYSVTAYRKKTDSKGNTKIIATPGTLRMTSAEVPITRAVGNTPSLYDAGDNVWYGILDSDSSAFTLQNDDYYIITLPVPKTPDSTVNYKASENKPKSQEQWYLDGKEYDRHGDLEPGEQKVETYINSISSPSLYITKTVVRTDGKQDNNQFAFTVTLSDKSYTDGNFTNGVATFYLKNGESIFLPLEKIRADGSVTYTVTEDFNSEYTTTSTNAKGTIIDGSMISVDFFNIQITPDPGYLVIKETGGKSNESFLYKITDAYGSQLIVSVKGGGETYVCAPCGYYTIEEITDWAWQYEDGKCVDPNTGARTASVIITADNNTPNNAVHAYYTNKRNDKAWLGSESRRDNHFDGPPSDGDEQDDDPGRTEYTVPAIAYIDRKKKYGEGSAQ